MNFHSMTIGFGRKKPAILIEIQRFTNKVGFLAQGFKVCFPQKNPKNSGFLQRAGGGAQRQTKTRWEMGRFEIDCNTSDMNVTKPFVT